MESWLVHLIKDIEHPIQLKFFLPLVSLVGARATHGPG